MALAGMCLLGLLLVAGFFWFAFQNPNNYYFGSGDGIQAYFTTAYQARYGTGTHFGGMNYPEGDHINYPNLQPLVAGTMGLLELVGLPVAQYTVGITNMLALLGLALAPAVLFLILRRLRLPTGYAALTAVLIAFLSPQLYRLGGHLALSYPVFIPWLWYCIIRMQEQPLAARWYVVFAISLTLMGFIVPYYVALGSFFVFGHVLILLIWRRLGPLPWRMMLAAVLPLLVVQGWLWLTDTVTDRPVNPYGIMVYKATPETVFLPVLPPLQGWWSEHWPFTHFPLQLPDMEGWAYVGMAATFTLLATLLWAVVAVVARTPRTRLAARWAAVPVPVRTGLGAGVLLLLFSFAIPFRFESLAWLTDRLGPVKQFRSLGRFAWPFYYVAGCYTAYGLYQGWQAARGGWHWLRVAIPLVLVGWAAEAWINVTHIANIIRGLDGAAWFLDANTSITRQLSWINRQPSDFQAILPIPYFNLGTDKFGFYGSEKSFHQGYKTAFVTGLPLLANYITRASAGSALRHVQLLSSPMLPKELLTTFPNNKPILLLVTPDYLQPYEQRIVSLAKLLYTTPEGSLYELPVAALAATTLAEEQALAAARLPQLPMRPGGLYCTTSKGVWLNTFSDSTDRRGHLGAGAFHEPAEKFSILYDGPVPAPADTGRYEISLWVNGKTAYGLGNIQEVQYAGDQQLDHQVASAMMATEIDGDWMRVVLPVRMRLGVTRLLVVYDNRDLLADELLIRPVDTDVYYYAKPGHPRSLTKNTYPLFYPASSR